MHFLLTGAGYQCNVCGGREDRGRQHRQAFTAADRRGTTPGGDDDSQKEEKIIQKNYVLQKEESPRGIVD